MIRRVGILALFLFASVPLDAQPTGSDPAEEAPELPHGHIISRRDVRVGGGVGVGPQSDVEGLVETTVTMTVESRYLGPFSAQVGGAYSPGGLDVAGLTIGLGLASKGEGGRFWTMLGVWEQLTGRSVSHAASLSSGFQFPVAGRFGVFGEGRAMVSDVRVRDPSAGVTAWGIVGMNVTL